MSESTLNVQSIAVTIIDGSLEIFSKTFEKEMVTFGRSPKMDIPLDYDFVSRAHGNLTYENGTWFLNDLKSSNGTFVGGQRIARIAVQDEMKFQLGRLVITVKVSAHATTDPDDEVTAPTIIPAAPLAHSPPPPPRPTQLIKPVLSQKSIQKSSQTANSGSTSTVPLQSPQRIAQIAHEPMMHGNVATPSYVPGYVPLSNRDFSEDLLGVHNAVHVSKRRTVEAIVTWYNQIYDVKEFSNGITVTAGPMGLSSLKVPTLKDPVTLARIDQGKVHCLIPQGAQVSMNRSSTQSLKATTMAMGDLLASKALQTTAFGYALKMDFHDVVHIDLGSGMVVHFRFVPQSDPLPNWNGDESANAFKQSIISSFALHGALLLLILLAAPPVVHGPKLKNVPERFARLLVEKPKPKPTPFPTPVPKPPSLQKEIAKKPVPPKKIEKVVQKIMKPPKVIERVNKFPIVVQHPIPKAPPPVKVENLGALAALGAISKDAAPSVVKNIYINKNAGGAPTKSMNAAGIVGALSSSNGALLAGGSRVKTKGMGFGSGTGYGVQGLKGSAGSRAVAGAVVGEPKLAKSGKVEGLSRAQVMAVIQKYLGEVQHCYERNLLSNPDLAGRMEFEWDIANTGDVTNVRVKRSTVNNGDNLGECVKGLFGSMKFPRASNGQGTTPSIGFPFGRL